MLTNRVRSLGWLALAAFLPLSCVAAEPAHRIVSLAPNLTELAFTAGAGEQLVGTVEYSDTPPAAKKLPRIGDAFRVDFEKILALAPDVVLAWEPGTPVATVEKLRAFHLRVTMIHTGRLAEIGSAVRTIGELAGTSGIAEAAARDFESQLQSLRQLYAARAPVRVFVEIQNQPLYTVGGKQIISEIVSLCGGENVFASLSSLAPAVGIESVIAADPQAILSLDETVATPMTNWAGWPSITAVGSGNVFRISADSLSRATTATLEGMRATCEALNVARSHLQRAGKGG